MTVAWGNIGVLLGYADVSGDGTVAMDEGARASLTWRYDLRSSTYGSPADPQSLRRGTDRMARLTLARLLTRGALAVMMALSCGLALGQTPSAAQMEAFQNLTPEQQQAILEQMGGSGQTGTVRRDRDVTAPETVRPRTTNADEEADEFPAELDMQDPREVAA